MKKIFSKKNIYIDTSALKSIGFNLNHHGMRTIIKNVNDYGHTVLTNFIFENEFLKHCDEILQKEKNSIKTLEAIELICIKEIQTLTKKAKTIESKFLFEQYKKKLNCKNIDKEIDWKSVFEKYYSKKPPFSKVKKTEFPDAFVIELLDPYVDKNLHIITGDNDFYNWASGFTKILCFRSIKEFADHIIKEESKNNQIIRCFEENKETIELEIIDYINNRYQDSDQYQLTSYHSEIEDASIRDIQITEFNMLEIDEISSSLEIEFNANGDVLLDIISSVVIYDSIDKEDIFMGSNRNTASIQAHFSGKIRIDFSENYSEITFIEIYDTDIISEDFNVPDEWETFVNDPDS